MVFSPSLEKTQEPMKARRPLVLVALPSVLTIAGLAPMFLLLSQEHRSELNWFILYYLVMDDLDGSVARALGTESHFGKHLDDTCDAVVHSIVAVIGGLELGGIAFPASIFLAIAIVTRMAIRSSGLRENTPWGEPGNEASVMWLLALPEETIIWPGANLALPLLLIIHAIMMLAPFPVNIIRTRLVRPAGVVMFYATLAAACLFPAVKGPVLIVYIVAHLCAVLGGSISWLKRAIFHGSI